MRTRYALLFVAVAFLTMAPAAMAQYCKRCAQIPVTHCVNAINVDGYPDCEVVDLECVFGGDLCEAGGPTAALASDYTVVAVERLDQPQPSPRAPRVAAAEIKSPTP